MKRAYIIFLSLFCLLIFASCNRNDVNSGVKNDDWSFLLPNDYAIIHINSRKIVLGIKKTEYSFENVLEKYIVEFCYGNRFIGLKCVDFQLDLSKEIDLSNLEYYIIDSQTQKIYGPFIEKEYSKQCQALSTDNLCDWIKTKPRPDNAIFE